jgi:hypothetical protein
MDTSNSLLRAAFDRARAKFPNFIVQRQELRIENLLQPNQNQYQFQLKQGNSTSDGPVNILLNDEDAFVLVATMLYVKKQNTTAVPNQYANSQPFTYPEPQVFVGTPAGQAQEWQALFTIWNGRLSFKTGSLERIKPMDTLSHLYVPAAQVIPADDGTLLTLANNTLAEFNGPNIENFAWVEQQPTLLVDGKQNNVFTLQLGSGDTTAIDGSYAADGDQDAVPRNVVGLRCLGLLIQNGASEAKRYESSWQ